LNSFVYLGLFVTTNHQRIDAVMMFTNTVYSRPTNDFSHVIRCCCCIVNLYSSAIISSHRLKSARL